MTDSGVLSRTKPAPAADAGPTRLLIAALGGEGGGVLAGWITEAAVASGLVASRTSIPGVAQRTGATTYYIEMMAAEPGRPRPVLALNPAPGHVDVLVASELLEATRLAGAGMMTSDRTTLIANTARVYTMDEKMAMTDGRVDSVRLSFVLRGASKRAVLADLGAAAAASKSPISAVMLGALAAVRALPLSDDALRAAIRREGKAVDANLAGFAAGYAVVAGGSADGLDGATSATPLPALVPIPTVAAVTEFPARAGVFAAEGVKRLTDYQNAAYAETYLAAIRRLQKVPGVDDGLLAEFARQLAVRMSVEDVIRVAQLKLRAARVARVTAEARARPGDIVDITEFMKPGAEEILGLLPPFAARPLLRAAEAVGWSKAALPMTVTTTRFGGFLRLKLLAGLRAWRPYTQKFSEEQRWLSRWLSLVEAAARLDALAAREVVTSAKLVRGYGDTYKRGLAHWDRIATTLVDPVLAAGTASPRWADEILQARLAAEKDPEGKALEATLQAIALNKDEPRRPAQ